MQVLQFKKSNPCLLFYKKSAGNLEQYNQVLMPSNDAGKHPSEKERKKKLMKMLQFVPPIHREFYKCLKILGAQP